MYIKDAPQLIKERVRIEDVCAIYGVHPLKNSFALCPFHGEKTPSLRIYKDSGTFHCFGCGEHGDVIAFTQKLFGLSFGDTLQKIDADFGLGIFDNLTFEEVRRAHYRHKAFEAAQERRKREKKLADKAYWDAFEEWKRLDDNRRIYKPNSPNEELHPLFVESLQKLTHQEYLVDCLNERRDCYA